MGRYLEIHATAMRTLERDGRVLPDGDGLTIEPVARGLLIEGRVHCAGSLIVEVWKLLAIAREGPVTTAQTTSYTYQVMVDGLGDLFRYCGPHKHRPFHHKHTYDVLGDDAGAWVKVDPEERPTLSEVIWEASECYFKHADQIEARRASK